jgi:hypothetical protein
VPAASVVHSHTYHTRPLFAVRQANVAGWTSHPSLTTTATACTAPGARALAGSHLWESVGPDARMICSCCCVHSQGEVHQQPLRWKYSGERKRSSFLKMRESCVCAGSCLLQHRLYHVPEAMHEEAHVLRPFPSSETGTMERSDAASLLHLHSTRLTSSVLPGTWGERTMRSKAHNGNFSGGETARSAYEETRRLHRSRSALRLALLAVRHARCCSSCDLFPLLVVT